MSERLLGACWTDGRPGGAGEGRPGRPPGRHRLLPGLVVTLLLAVGSVGADAQDMPGLAAAWYDALRTADRPALSSLLDGEATVELRDLGIVQNREEFLESLDSWEDAMSGSSIEVRTLSTGAEAVVADVCYRFPGNAQRNRETFAIASGYVIRVVQEMTASHCDGF